MYVLPKAIFEFNRISITISMAYFIELEHVIQKVIWDHRRLQIVSAILRKNKVGDLTLPDSKVFYHAIVIEQHGTGIKTDMEINATG